MSEALMIGLSIAGLSLVLSLVGIVAVRQLIIHMPADYFARPHPITDQWRRRHPALRYSFLVVKNLVGLALLVAGLAMLVAPGPGVLAVLFGLSLVDFPGKRALQARIVSHPRVLQTINRIRAAADRPPLKVEPHRDPISQQVN